jgi:hypothetical protein
MLELPDIVSLAYFDIVIPTAGVMRWWRTKLAPCLQAGSYLSIVLQRNFRNHPFMVPLVNMIESYACNPAYAQMALRQRSKTLLQLVNLIFPTKALDLLTAFEYGTSRVNNKGAHITVMTFQVADKPVPVRNAVLLAEFNAYIGLT